MLKLDEIDHRILSELQKDGRIPNNILAERVRLSPSPCLRRVKILEEAGIVDRYVAILEPTAVGIGVTVFARVRLHSQDASTIEHFTLEVRKLMEVVECYLISGDCDFLLRIVATDLNAYREFQMSHLTRIEGVKNVRVEIPMRQIKQTTELPLPV